MTTATTHRSEQPVDWIISEGPVDYEAAVAFMEARVAAIRAGQSPELIWLLEHPSLYTAGTSAKPADLLLPDRFPVYTTGRGGQYTYHGPGQRVVYVMLDLNRRGRDVRAFVSQLEAWLIDTLRAFNICGERREERVGVWVRRGDLNGAREDKIAALGIRLRRWVSYHGLSINVDPDLTHFGGIVPCGIAPGGLKPDGVAPGSISPSGTAPSGVVPGSSEPLGVTSLRDLDPMVAMRDVDIALKAAFQLRFGPARLIPAGEMPGLP